MFEFTITDNKCEYKIPGGIGKMVEGKTDLLGKMTACYAPYLLELGKMSISSLGGYWCDSNTFVIKLQFIETPFGNTIKLCFNGNKIEIRGTTNVNNPLGSNELPILKGEL
ncbi:hypothetical protein [Clostridium sp.]|uniref:hypothetical protein n=1 Tax=Clostridium sp. TaxID=1506 RepID=UPI003D6D0790